MQHQHPNGCTGCWPYTTTISTLKRNHLLLGGGKQLQWSVLLKEVRVMTEIRTYTPMSWAYSSKMSCPRKLGFEPTPFWWLSHRIMSLKHIDGLATTRYQEKILGAPSPSPSSRRPHRASFSLCFQVEEKWNIHHKWANYESKDVLKYPFITIKWLLKNLSKRIQTKMVKSIEQKQI